MVRAGRELALPVGSLSLLTLLQTHVKPVSNALMVLSNKERQARYRQRLKEAAERGVTPGLIVSTLKDEWERERADDPSMQPWADYVADCRRNRAGRERWRSDVLAMLDLENWEGTDLGPDPATLRKVLAVMRAVLEPPASEDAA